MKIFTEQQYRGLLILLPIALVIVAIAVAIELLPSVDAPDKGVEQRLEQAGAKPYSRVENGEKEAPLCDFNPNTYTYEELRSAGVPKEVAVGIVRWRGYGKVFRLKEDIALVSGVTDSIYSALKPYIIIADSLAPTPRKYDAPKSKREVAKREEKSAVQEVEKSVTQTVEKSAKPALLEINSADTTALIAINGIGSKSAAEIVKYRDLLGGYHSVEQISELKCITEQNYEKILQQICCDSCKISKIDINFATAKAVGRHPYVSSAALRKIFKQRQLKGGWSRIEEMVEDEILSEDEAKRLAPYLWFRLDATE